MDFITFVEVRFKIMDVKREVRTSQKPLENTTAHSLKVRRKRVILWGLDDGSFIIGSVRFNSTKQFYNIQLNGLT